MLCTFKKRKIKKNTHSSENEKIDGSSTAATECLMIKNSMKTDVASCSWYRFILFYCRKKWALPLIHWMLRSREKWSENDVGEMESAKEGNRNVELKSSRIPREKREKKENGREIQRATCALWRERMKNDRGIDGEREKKKALARYSYQAYWHWHMVDYIIMEKVEGVITICAYASTQIISLFSIYRISNERETEIYTEWDEMNIYSPENHVDRYAVFAVAKFLLCFCISIIFIWDRSWIKQYVRVYNVNKHFVWKSHTGMLLIF